MVMLGARLWIVICVTFSVFLAILYLHLSTEISQIRSYVLKKGKKNLISMFKIRDSKENKKFYIICYSCY